MTSTSRGALFEKTRKRGYAPLDRWQITGGKDENLKEYGDKQILLYSVLSWGSVLSLFFLL